MKRVLHFLILFTGSIFISLSGFSQSIDYNSFLKLPAVLPPSPDAAAIDKFGNVPVDYCTGVADISIPVWNIKCGELTWPISIAYHSGGIHVDEVASSVGIGWSLNGPGVITRSVVGQPDENAAGNPNYDSISNKNWQFLYAAWLGHADSELDIFSYNFNGRSGKFVVNQNGTILQIPYSNLRIVNNGLGSFTITDEKGISYLFSQLEISSTMDNNIGLATYYTSAWYLSRVMLPDQKDSISFVYGNGGGSNSYPHSFTHSIGQRYLDYTSLTYFNETSYSAYTNSNQILKPVQINFPNGNINLNYSATARQDITGPATNQLSNLIINQQSKSGFSQIKQFVLKQSYFYFRPPSIPTDNPTQYRLRLDSLYEYGNSLIYPPKRYTFEYNQTPIDPRDNYGQDIWGYNNGKYDNVNLIQTQNIVYNGSPYTIGNSDRSVDTMKMQACMLTAIHYPTGGKTVFEYEANRYNTQQSVVNTSNYSVTAFGDGVQTGSATFTTTTGMINIICQVNMTAYNYAGVNNSPYVTLTDLTTSTTLVNMSQTTPSTPVQSFPVIGLTPGHNYQLKAYVFTNGSVPQVRSSIQVSFDTTSTQAITSTGGGLRIKTIKNYAALGNLATSETYQYDSAVTLTPFDLISRAYSNVVYALGYLQPPLECTYYISPVDPIYSSSSPYPIATVMGSPMLYQNVRKIMVDSTSGLNSGKSEYAYDVTQDQSHTLSAFFIDVPLISNEWKNGFLKSSTQYKLQNAVYSPIKKTVNQYTEFKNSQTYSLKVAGLYIHSGCTNSDSSFLTQNVNWAVYPVTTGSKKLTQSIDTLFDDYQNKQITITTNEYGNANNDFITKSTLHDSKGNLRSTSFKYPQDYAVTGNVYYKMVQSNILAPVIQQQSFEGTALLSTLMTSYRDWNNDSKVLAPEIVQASLRSNPMENRVQYYAYDSFLNPISVAKVNDVLNSYVWDYNHQIPIARAANAGTSDIAYTSFESDGAGNWSVPSSSRDTINFITGIRSYNLSSGNITKTGLTIGRIYIISYWSKNGSYTISGGTASSKTGRSVSPWTYYEQTVTASSTTITISGTGNIDELRLYPQSAQMVSYTYAPLVGATSINDPNSEITYYEYDSLQRLKNIKDYQGNIIKNYQYNYAQACTSCVVTMKTFASTPTLSYPVGVFSVNNTLLGNATTQAQFVTMWNADTNDHAIGTLSAGTDSMHFLLTINAGQTSPALVRGCRYYQYDLAYTQIDAVRSINGCYVDYGDGTGMFLGQSSLDTNVVRAPNTDLIYYHPGWGHPYQAYWIHNYPNSNQKTITFYHNDGPEHIQDLDDNNSPATSLTLVSNLRGNLPQLTTTLGGSCYQQAGALTTANISNWPAISSIINLGFYAADGGVSFPKNLNFPQDFMINNRNLANVSFSDCISGGFKVSKMKSGWNTYFTNLRTLSISDAQWDHENLSSLVNLSAFGLQTDNGLPGSTISTQTIDNVIIQIAGGSGQWVSNGIITISSGAVSRSTSSNAAVTALKAKGWTITINGVAQ